MCIGKMCLILQARAPGSPVIVVGTHGDRITNRREMDENLQSIARLYGSPTNTVEGTHVLILIG